MADTKIITQGHPTYHEPDDKKGGQDGAPKPDGRTRRDTATRPPAKDADTIITGEGPTGGVG
jgi:hypothetical protein